MTKASILESVKEILLQHTEMLRADLDSCLQDDGNTSESSQRMCILNRLLAVEQAIDGIEIDDLSADAYSVAK